MNELPFAQQLFILLQHCLPQHTLSRCVGYLAECQNPWLKSLLIRQFIRYFKVDMRIAKKGEHEYATFNEFFTRALVENCRPIDTDEFSLTSPTDGTISQFGKIDNNVLLQAKTRRFRLDDLLADSAMTDLFTNGQFATIYLSPKDYHRVHMPLTGKLLKTVYVPGRLFSVNQSTSEGVDNLFARNERLICLFETPFGPVAIILVGAMIVAGIETVWAGQVTPKPGEITTADFSNAVELNKGDELGRFKLGSTVILLLSDSTAKWMDWIEAESGINMGERLATLSKNDPIVAG